MRGRGLSDRLPTSTQLKKVRVIFHVTSGLMPEHTGGSVQPLSSDLEAGVPLSALASVLLKVPLLFE